MCLVVVQVMSAPCAPAASGSGRRLSPPAASGRTISARWPSTSTEVSRGRVGLGLSTSLGQDSSLGEEALAEALAEPRWSHPHSWQGSTPANEE